MKNFDWKGLLSRHHLFESLNKNEVDQLLRDEFSYERNYQQGSVILREGDIGKSIFLIGSGSVQVVLKNKKHPDIPLAVLEKGEFFGEMAPIARRPRCATVIAEENSTLLEIKGEEFLKIMKEHFDIAFHVILQLSERLRNVSEQILAVKQKDVYEKIDLFNTKLDSELKAVEIQWKAAHAVFDQTRIRADEVINSAERSRTRLTVVASAIATVIGAVLALFGWIGFSEIQNIRTDAGEVRKMKENISEITVKAKNDLKNIAQDLEHFNLFKKDFYKQIMIPKFLEETGKDEIKAKRYYKSILGAKDTKITDQLFEFLVTNIFFIGGTDRKYSKKILEKGVKSGYVQTDRQMILSYYLILSALILNKEHEGKEFEDIFSNYEEYIKDYDGPTIKNSLEKIIDLDEDEVEDMPKEDTDRKNKLEEIKALIP